MEREDFETIRFDQLATLMWRSEARVPETVEHFARLRDALDFAERLDGETRGSAWIVLDQGLIAPEDLPVLARRASAFQPLANA